MSPAGVFTNFAPVSSSLHLSILAPPSQKAPLPKSVLQCICEQHWTVCRAFCQKQCCSALVVGHCTFV
ncbi:TPA: hypothetical protein ACH3X3_011756 [Trebouxia sp. C0006]